MLCCEIVIAGEFEDSFVLLRNGLYLLPDPALAELTPTLIWCPNCDGFSDGESLTPLFELTSLLDRCVEGRLPEPYAYFYDTAQQIAELKERVRRSIHWRQQRHSPPKCLQCGCDEISSITSNLDEPFIDPRGRTVSYSQSIASTNIDHALFVYDADGMLIKEISRVCPETNDFIEDSYPPSDFLTLMEC